MITWKNKKHVIFVQESILIDNHAADAFKLCNNAEKFLFYFNHTQNYCTTYLILSAYNADRENLYKKLTRSGVDCFLPNIHIDNLSSNTNITLNRQDGDYWQNFITINQITPEDTCLFANDLLTALHAASLGIQAIVIGEDHETNMHNKINEKLAQYLGNLKFIKNFAELMPQKITFTDFIDAQTVT